MGARTAEATRLRTQVGTHGQASKHEDPLALSGWQLDVGSYIVVA